ncbi:hypothetical protein RJ639_008276 [Escallonia herrerae]|uniref:Nonsense-mediated mRNA decay factor SMG8 n=1 Tax=Escallonia herrerae TaxID=1293975 RepID=A0AA89AUN3_9ASTE|nr:hypothetical protein RJ639_008276 [Escallonia herrerae]
MDPPTSSSMRVLIRHPSSSSPSPTRPTLSPPSKPPLTPPPPSPHGAGGIVVVGFIGRHDADVTQLINRILDSNLFGSGGFDKTLGVEKEEVNEELKDWFKTRKISYYHEEEKGVLYLQFSSNSCPVMEGFLRGQSGFDSVLEERELDDLQGLLFMFSVCHIVVFIQDGSRFDIQILKQFRVLQAAKHAMAPFARSRTTPPLTSRIHTTSSSRKSPSRASSHNRSPGKTSGLFSRNPSAITLMSGLGSYTSFFPGQCTPVMLFVFLDDFSDGNPGYDLEELAETSSNQSSNLNISARPSLPMKGSGSVVVLSRPASKSEGGFSKKLQSSLEAQIRFSIKKCRTLSGSDSGHTGSRSGGISSTAPLFSLDASKAVALVDKSSNQRGESLEFAAGLVENILNGVATSDSLLLESHSQSSNKEDILSVKEFISRQLDILRGRGGMVANTNNGSAGVGMVAVAAAAAAAASAASGKTLTTPELPNLDIWLSSSKRILHGILSAKYGSVGEPEISKKPRQRNAFPPPVEGNGSKSTDPLDIAVFHLENGRGINCKFSTSWCQRALPVAKEIYFNDLPACYPTSKHKANLEKALCAFKSMVKGPAVQLFLEKLEDECTSVWSSGRQLCDAVSLTGNPCMHQRHDAETGSLLTRDEIKQHSSGFVFLHACACGRSRQLRADPFDFETANITSKCYAECDKLLPALQLPGGGTIGPIQPLSWSLIRIGGAQYYDSSKGLLQSGFPFTQKFLSKWNIYLRKPKNPNGSPPNAMQQIFMDRLSSEHMDEFNVYVKKAGAAQLYQEEMLSGGEFSEKPTSEINSDNKQTSSGRGVPHSIMRRPFSEVVAGSVAAYSGFPPLQSRKQPLLASEKGIKQDSVGVRGVKQFHETTDFQISQNTEDIARHEVNEDGNADGNPILQIGDNVVPVSVNSSEKIKSSTSLDDVIVYVGFEHECPRGHRFILTSEHLSEFGSSYTVPEESNVQSSVENLDSKVADSPKLGKNGGHGKVHRHPHGMVAAAVNKARNIGRSKEMVTKRNQNADRLMQLPRPLKEDKGMSALGDSMKDVEDSLHSISLDNGGSAFSLLDRSLPVYMNCPHCRVSKNKKDPPNVRFAGTISQLQRIFLVTPALPVILTTCPVVQFEDSCLPPSVQDREQKLCFSLGCPVVLPPESFLSLRLPFVYGVQLEDGSLHPLKPFDHQPELTAWVTKRTTLQVMSNGSNPEQGSLT